MHAHGITPELHLRIGSDGRIECRSSPTADAPALSIAPDFFGAPDSADAQRALGRFVFSLLQGLHTSDQAPPRRKTPQQRTTARTRCMKDSSPCRPRR
jgi:hypothetical protein